MKGVLEVVTELVSLHAYQRISRHELACIRDAQVLTYVDHILGALVVQMEVGIHGLPKERISIHRQWPKTWWDAFKLRWLPQWALKRWPAEYERIDVDKTIFYAVCPHLESPRRAHITWLLSQKDLCPSA